MKNVKGITLIALVITIVVLIILAGVAISLSLGENGIFNKAKYATEEYANEQAREEAEIAKTANEINTVIGGRGTVTLTKEEYEMWKNEHNYSTDEKVIGTWIDGKPIYRKTIPINQLMPANTSTMTIETDLILIDTIINIDCLYTVDQLSIASVYSYTLTSQRGFAVYQLKNDNTAQIAIRQEQTSGNTAYAKACIIEYTKTTDSAINN